MSRYTIRMRQPLTGLLVFFFVAIVAHNLAVPVHAQTPAPATEVSADAQLTQLREQYRTQLNNYRVDERNFTIARDQYYQLQTLRSLEDAVKATQKVLLSRDDVLITYLKMLRMTFSQTNGIQLQLKNDQLKNIDNLLVLLNKHSEETGHAVTKDQISGSVLSFSYISSLMQNTSSQVFLIMSYGKVQALFDKTVVIRNEVKSHVEQQQTDALKLSEKQRAFSQIDQTVDDADIQLKNVLSSLTTPQKYGGTQPAEGLNLAYAAVSRTLTYLQEVLNN